MQRRGGRGILPFYVFFSMEIKSYVIFCRLWLFALICTLICTLIGLHGELQHYVVYDVQQREQRLEHSVERILAYYQASHLQIIGNLKRPVRYFFKLFHSFILEYSLHYNKTSRVCEISVANASRTATLKIFLIKIE